MNRSRFFRPALPLLALLLAGASAATATEPPGNPLPTSVREYLVKKYFPGKTPDDPAIEKAVEVLRVPQSLLIAISQNDWADRQLLRFPPRNGRAPAAVAPPLLRGSRAGVPGHGTGRHEEGHEARLRLLL